MRTHDFGPDNNNANDCSLKLGLSFVTTRSPEQSIVIHEAQCAPQAPLCQTHICTVLKAALRKADQSSMGPNAWV